MEEYESLKEMVRIEIEVDEFDMWGGMVSTNKKEYTWIKEHNSSNSRKGIIINKNLWNIVAMKLITIGYYQIFNPCTLVNLGVLSTLVCIFNEQGDLVLMIL